MIIMRISYFILISLLFLPLSVNAQGHNVYCDMADSTAATQGCLKKHLDSAQSRLKKVYDGLLVKLETEEEKQQLKDLQKTWLAYRDAECQWEAERTETASLKRINELSCMARVTDGRADLLTVVSADEALDGSVREYGSFPRWMNVLAKDYPSVYWDYGKRFAEDLDCDEEPEQIMTGLSVKKEGDVLKQEMTIAVVQNPVTGRPKAQLFKFNVGDEAQEATLCNSQVTLAIAQEKATEEVEGQDEAQDNACLAYLEVKHGTCTPRKIKWDGKSFQLEMLPVKEEEKEAENKKISQEEKK